MTSRRKRKKLDSPPAVDVRFERNWEKRARNDYFYSGLGGMWPPAVKYWKCRVCKGNPHHPPTFTF